jgi:thiamine-monophosphate kinase
VNEDTILSDIIFPNLNNTSDIIVPPGDDCAVIDLGLHDVLLISTDQLVENIHYDPKITSPQEAGEKLLKRNISDIAAMGGVPKYATVTIASVNKKEEWFSQFYEGINKISKQYDISICGGDLSSTKNEDMVATLTIFGFIEKGKQVLRSTANDTDIILCTGYLGNSYHSKHHITFAPRVDVGQFLSKNRYATSMMDITDGLNKDLNRLCSMSNLGAVINLDKLPLREGATIEAALFDGEDYELIFSVSKENVNKFIDDFKTNFKDLNLSELGYFTNKELRVKYLAKNKDYFVNSDLTGFDHFK